MPSFTTPKVEGKNLSDWLVYEEDDIGRLSRENVVLAGTAASVLPTGTVLGFNAADNTYVPYDNLPADGGAGESVGEGVASSVAKAILVETTTIPASGTIVVAAIVRFARVVGDQLTFPTGMADADKAAALVDLAAANIVSMRSV